MNWLERVRQRYRHTWSEPIRLEARSNSPRVIGTYRYVRICDRCGHSDTVALPWCWGTWGKR